MDTHYDIAIIGLGCAGSHVALELLARPETQDLKIVVLDDFSRESMHKTWSYWEQGKGKWDDLIAHEWLYAIFNSTGVSKKLNLGNYRYKSIDSAVFIKHTIQKLASRKNVTLIKESVQACDEQEDWVNIHYKSGSCSATQVLDSRLSPAFFKSTKNITLDQHFKGWVIKSEQPVFQPDAIVMMDYRLKDEGTTSFMYVLPYDANTALVEFTYFSKKAAQDCDYDAFLNRYIKDYLQIDRFEIMHTEQGSIPMTHYNFSRHHTQHIHKIGTAGGWVKPSTGYSFKSSEKKAALLVDNYMAGRALDCGLFSKKFMFYDAIMLEVLAEDNSRGPVVFRKLYTKQPIARIFAFLDEETTITTEVRIMLPLTSFAFIKYFFKRLPQLFN